MIKNLYILILLLLISSVCRAKDCIPDRQFELVQNGNFELGDTLFISEYNYNPRGKNEKTYSVSDNPNLSYSRFDSCGDHTSGFGKMMIVNGDSILGTVVWMQTINNIKPGIDYEFNFWYTPLNKLRAPILLVVINGDTLNPNPIYMIDSSCNWQQAVLKWNSGIDDTAEIRIYDVALHVAGNDFALDDLSFTEFCKLQICAGQNLYVCRNKSIQLNAEAMDGYEPYIYSWSPSAGLDNANAKSPLATPSQTTTYIATATDRLGCISHDTITVFTYDGPDNLITADLPMPVCPCQPVILSARPGYNYLWSTGQVTQSISVLDEGTYFVDLTDQYGCLNSGSFIVSHKPVTIKVAIDTIFVESGKQAKSSISLLEETNLFDCGYEDFSADISFNASVIKPDSKYGGSIINGNQIINIKDKLSNSAKSEIDFTAAFGNSFYTELEFQNFKLNCDAVKTVLLSGRVYITDICYEGGPRLIDLSETVSLTSLLHNDFIDINFSIIENTHTSVSLTNYKGEVCSMPVNSLLKPGSYELQQDISNLANGLYFIILKSGSVIKLTSFIR